MKVFLKVLFPLLVLAGGVFAYQYLKSTATEPEPIQRRFNPPVVSTQVIESGEVSPTTRLFGSVESPSLGQLTTAVEADVTEVRVLEGESVDAGEILVVLDNTDFSLELLQREAELAEIEALIESDRLRLEADRKALQTERELLDVIQRSVERASTLSQSRAGSEAALDEARQSEQRQRLAIIQRQQSIDDAPARQRQLAARKAKAKAAVDRARRDMDRAVIRAPYAGRIADVKISEGDRVARGGIVLSIYNRERLELRAQVPSAIVPSLLDAMDREVGVNAVSYYNNQEIRLELDRMSALVEAGQGGVDAFFRPVSGDLPIWGITLELQVQLPPLDNVVMLSPDAIYDQDRIYLVKEGILESTNITVLGERLEGPDERWILVDGADVENGARVLISRLPRAISGLEVDARQ